MSFENESLWDCVVIGAGAAGLSAALSLGRARRRTLVIDAGAQSNLAAHGVGGLLGHDRRPPSALYAKGRDELTAYPSATVLDGSVVAVHGAVDVGFSVVLEDGETQVARRVLLAGGMEYRHIDIPGAAERWGSTVFHCPFCHGWEVAGRPLAVLNPAQAGVHQALLLTAWSENVTLLAGAELADGDRARLDAAGVAVEQRPAVALHGPENGLESIELADGSQLTCGGLLIGMTLHQRSDLVARLGVRFADANPMTSEGIEIDTQNRTSVPGIYAAGDITVGPPSVARAVAQGGFAAAMIVGSLTGAM